MQKIPLALFLSACAFVGLAQAQERPPANTVVQSTDPDVIAQAEQHAQEAQASAQSSETAPPPSEKHHPHRAHHKAHPAKAASTP